MSRAGTSTSRDPLEPWRIPAEVPAERSVDQLEGLPHSDPAAEPFPLGQRLALAAARPIRDLDAGEVRLLLSQLLGVRWILPRALALLAADPLICATFHPGDLLVHVLCHDEVAQANPQIVPALRAAIEGVERAATEPAVDGETSQRTEDALWLLELLERQGKWPWNPPLSTPDRAP